MALSCTVSHIQPDIGLKSGTLYILPVLKRDGRTDGQTDGITISISRVNYNNYD